MEKILEELVHDYANELDKISLARCNVAQYEVPVEVYHYPTIKLYPAGKKRSPVEYFGKEDDLDQYKAFITSEGSTSDRSEVLQKAISRHGKGRQGSNPEEKGVNGDMQVEGD